MRSQGLLGRQTAFCPRHWLAPTANSLTRSDRRKKGDDRCKAGDVVLYKRPPDSYVLHRVVEVRENDYVILGDNCAAKEYGIKDADILGVMTGYVRGGREHSTDDAGYRLYSSVWMHTISLRIALKKAVQRLKNLVKKIIRP